MLAGVEIDAEKGPLGHSDADVVIHAVIDAMLGAAALGDIGEHFPDSDPAYKDIAGRELMAQTCQKLAATGYAVVNVDATVILETPKLGPHKKVMRERLAQLLKMDLAAVSIKAKTNEGLGSLGTGAAIACQAVVALREL